MLSLQESQPVCLLGAAQFRGETLDPFKKEPGMGILYSQHFATFVKLLPRILSYRCQHPEARLY